MRRVYRAFGQHRAKLRNERAAPDGEAALTDLFILRGVPAGGNAGNFCCVWPKKFREVANWLIFSEIICSIYLRGIEDIRT
jgi:hypothetical protein